MKHIIISVEIDDEAFNESFFEDISQFLIHNFSSNKEVKGKIFEMEGKYPLFFLQEDVNRICEIKWNPKIRE